MGRIYTLKAGAKLVQVGMADFGVPRPTTCDLLYDAVSWPRANRSRTKTGVARGASGVAGGSRFNVTTPLGTEVEPRTRQQLETRRIHVKVGEVGLL